MLFRQWTGETKIIIQNISHSANQSHNLWPEEKKLICYSSHGLNNKFSIVCYITMFFNVQYLKCTLLIILNGALKNVSMKKKGKTVFRGWCEYIKKIPTNALFWLLKKLETMKKDEYTAQVKMYVCHIRLHQGTLDESSKGLFKPYFCLP